MTAEEVGEKLKLSDTVIEWLKKGPKGDKDPLLILTYPVPQTEQERAIMSNALVIYLFKYFFH
jgi:hypothetical protein